MHKYLIKWLLLFLLIPACSSKRVPEILVACQENNVGNYIIQWETYPIIKGKVKVYESSDPFNIAEKKPVAMADISDQQITIITKNPNQRLFFCLFLMIHTE